MANKTMYRPIDELLIKDGGYDSIDYTTTYSNNYYRSDSKDKIKSPPIGMR